jgi:hypothetical protein
MTSRATLDAVRASVRSSSTVFIVRFSVVDISGPDET